MRKQFPILGGTLHYCSSTFVNRRREGVHSHFFVSYTKYKFVVLFSLNRNSDEVNFGI